MNILFMTTDEQRPDCMGSGEFGALQVPNIDRLRREGTLLPNAYSNCPICMPTRFTWLYGLYASQGGQRLLANAHDWPTRLPSMTHVLQKNGYATALIGKLHSLSGVYHRDIYAHRQETMDRGFDDVVEISGGMLANYFDCDYTRYLDGRGLLGRYREFCARYEKTRHDYAEIVEPFFLAPRDQMDGYVAGQATQWIDGYTKDRPFYLHVSFPGPHWPMVPSEEFFGRHRRDDMPDPIGITDPGEMEKWRRNRALYADFTAQLDGHIGSVIGALERKGILDKTLIIFTTDHGDMIGDHGFPYKEQPYESSCRTPVILRYPGAVPSGETRETLTEAVDIPATILDAAGLAETTNTYLPQSPGLSFWPVVTGAERPPREWIYSEVGSLKSVWRMVRDKRNKYVFRPNGGDELYDLVEDPLESRNLIKDSASAGVLSELRHHLLTSMSSCVAPNSDGNIGNWIHREAFSRPNNVRALREGRSRITPETSSSSAPCCP